MSKEIEAYINSMAEKEYTFAVSMLTDDGQVKGDSQFDWERAEGFVTGALSMIPVMEGFTKWKDLNFEEVDLGLYTPILEATSDNYKNPFTIKQLLELYIKSISNE